MINNKGYELIKLYEGFRSKPYLDPVGIPTIGYGNTLYEDGKKVRLGDDSITKEKASALFKNVADDYALKVKKLITSSITKNQFSALVSFAYNVGVAGLAKSTLLKKVNQNPSDETIKDEFAKYIFAKGKKLNGLIKRREAEASLYFENSINIKAIIPIALLFFLGIYLLIRNKNK